MIDSTSRGFNCLFHLSIKKWYKKQIHFYASLNKFDKTAVYDKQIWVFSSGHSAYATLMRRIHQCRQEIAVCHHQGSYKCSTMPLHIFRFEMLTQSVQYPQWTQIHVYKSCGPILFCYGITVIGKLISIAMDNYKHYRRGSFIFWSIKNGWKAI